VEGEGGGEGGEFAVFLNIEYKAVEFAGNK